MGKEASLLDALNAVKAEDLEGPTGRSTSWKNNWRRHSVFLLSPLREAPAKDSKTSSLQGHPIIPTRRLELTHSPADNCCRAVVRRLYAHASRKVGNRGVWKNSGSVTYFATGPFKSLIANGRSGCFFARETNGLLPQQDLTDRLRMFAFSFSNGNDNCPFADTSCDGLTNYRHLPRNTVATLTQRRWAVSHFPTGICPKSP